VRRSTVPMLLAAAALLAAASSSHGQEAPAPEREAAASHAPDAAPSPAGKATGNEGEAAPAASAAKRTGESAAGPAERSGEVPYTVECRPDPQTGENVCFVDRDTYVGWRTFHGVCHTCHGQDALGSTFAPNLLVRIKEIDKARFIHSVDQGYEGQVGVMPAWGSNPNVNKYYEQLWSYLRARADGALPPGRPQRLPDSQ
jgi:hypothetical protein